MTIAFAFLCGVVMDILWVRCVTDVQRRRSTSAANASVMLYLCTLVSTVLVVQGCILACVAFATGSWVGTYFAVEIRK
jgi:hypothetical protein